MGEEFGWKVKAWEKAVPFVFFSPKISPPRAHPCFSREGNQGEEGLSSRLSYYARRGPRVQGQGLGALMTQWRVPGTFFKALERDF